jgi:hypothetical protein
MCGIFGILANNGTVSPLLLERATDSLLHRGPDDGGTVVIPANTTPRLEIGLGSRRLAILDLSPLGHQPMQDPQTGNWIVYNVHRKKSFALPFERWLRENLRPEVEATLQKIVQGPLGPLLNHNSPLQVWDDFLRQRSRVWALYVLERWCELNSVTA